MEATKHRLIAIRFPDGLPETEPLCIVQQSTFDQAREALKLARRRLNEGMHGKIDAVMEHGGDPGIVKLLDETLAAMEATPCQPDK